MPTELGAPGKTVEIDKSKFGETKCHQGTQLKGRPAPKISSKATYRSLCGISTMERTPLGGHIAELYDGQKDT